MKSIIAGGTKKEYGYVNQFFILGHNNKAHNLKEEKYNFTYSFGELNSYSCGSRPGASLHKGKANCLVHGDLKQSNRIEQASRGLGST